MAEGRKQAISLTLSAGDIRRIKKPADRLGVLDSDLVRFAIRMILHRMLLLSDPAVRGRSLVPVLAEWGPEAVRYFELDASNLEEIVDRDAPEGERVEIEDLSLLAVLSPPGSYAKLSLRALTSPSRPPAQGDRRDASLVNAVRRHLYGKYGFAATAAPDAGPAVPVEVIASLRDDEPAVSPSRSKGTRR